MSETPLVELSICGRTHVGRVRAENQDAFLVAELRDRKDAGRVRFGSAPSDAAGRGEGDIQVGPQGLVLIVADGMGGAAGGAVASALAVETITGELESGWNEGEPRTPAAFARRLRTAVEEANRRIHARAAVQRELRGMGTTVTAAGVLDGIVCVAQVGDSRAYLVRSGRAFQITRDQSMVQDLVEKGTMTPQEAERSPHRHVLLQALGTEPRVRVDLTRHELRRGDQLLLCSDGLSNPVEDEEIAAIGGSSPSPAEVCDELVALANARGGADNITLVLARVGGSGIPLPDPSDPAPPVPLDP